MRGAWLIAGRNPRVRPVHGVVTPEAVGFSDGYDTFGLAGNETFDSENPTLKDGTPLTGDMLTYHDAALYWMQNPTTSGDWYYNSWQNRFANLDSYHAARWGEIIQGAHMRVFRMTGDLRILDIMVDAYDTLAANFVSTWLSTADYAAIEANTETSACDGFSGPNYPWHPYEQMTLYRGAGGSTWADDTELSYLNYFKLMALKAEFAWALHVNRGKTSPGGKDYAAKANYWGQHIENFVDTASGSGSECWRGNYTLVTSLTSGSKTKATWGSYPIFRQDEGHAAFNGIIGHRYIGLLGGTSLWDIPNPSDALQASLDDAARYEEYGLIPCTTSYGDSRATKWSRPLGSATYTNAQPAVYTGYVASSAVTMWMTGAYRDEAVGFTRQAMRELGNAFAEMHDGTTGATLNCIIGNSDKCGLAATGSARTALQNALYGFCIMGVLADGTAGAHLDSVMDDVMTNTAGGYSTPNSGVIASAQFTKAALGAAGDL